MTEYIAMVLLKFSPLIYAHACFTFTGADVKYISSGKSSNALGPIALIGMRNFSLSVMHINSWWKSYIYTMTTV